MNFKEKQKVFSLKECEMDNHVKKDSLTGNEIVDVEFWEDLYPPKKLKQTDAGKAWADLWKEIKECWDIRPPKKKKEKHPSVRAVNPYKQPCTVKMYYTSSRKNHLEFLRNYMPQRNKEEVVEKPELFNMAYDSVPDELIEEYIAKADARGFKIILSPESQNVPMKVLARTFIQRLEKITGHHFDWFGVTHTNTDHIHCHLLINGVDRQTGETIRFKRNLVQSGFRDFASDICTSIVGPRSKEMIEQARSHLPESRRYTKIDEAIKNSRGYFTFDTPENINDILYEASITTSNDSFQKRLGFLCSIGLAHCYSHSIPPVYFLEKGWAEKLKSEGRYNTYLAGRDLLKYVSKQSYRMYTSDMGMVEGVVTKIYRMNDEDIWNNAIIVENESKNVAWYIPVMNIDDGITMNQYVQVFCEKSQHGKFMPTTRILNK